MVCAFFRKFGIKFVLVFLVLTGSILAGQKLMAATIVDRIVAVVNDEIITLSDLNETLQPYLQRLKESHYPLDKEMGIRFKLRGDMIEQLINKKISDQRIAKAGIKVSENEIDQAIERIKKGNSFTDEKLRGVLVEEGLTMKDYRKNIREQLLRTRLVNYEVKSKIVITDEEAKKWYSLNSDKVDNKPYAEVTQKVNDLLYRQKVESKFNEWIKKLRSEAQIKIIN